MKNYATKIAISVCLVISIVIFNYISRLPVKQIHAFPVTSPVTPPISSPITPKPALPGISFITQKLPKIHTGKYAMITIKGKSSTLLDPKALALSGYPDNFRYTCNTIVHKKQYWFSCTLSGKPKTAGTWNVSFNVTQDDQIIASQNYSLKVSTKNKTEKSL